MRYQNPYARPGQVIGLLGGSFDPAHAGHVHISKEAQRRFGLDRVWWLVSPGNPLKARGPAPLVQRVERARALVGSSGLVVTDIEARLRTRYTAQTLVALRQYYSGVRFVWLMGADNLAQFHHWQNWREIMESVPIGVIARPGDRISARMSKPARIYGSSRISGGNSQALARSVAPAWCFVNVPMSAASSTDIRARGEW